LQTPIADDPIQVIRGNLRKKDKGLTWGNLQRFAIACTGKQPAQKSPTSI
jgi:hypothetical protein